jgi:hypothetical protein
LWAWVSVGGRNGEVASFPKFLISGQARLEVLRVPESEGR